MSETLWQRPTTPPPLAPGEVHIWRVVVADFDPTPPVLLDILSTEERTRLARLHRADDRQRFCVARGLLRQILGGYLGMDAAAVAFAYGPNGKPMLAPRIVPRLEFNVSHAGETALIAVSLGQAVGVDVEQVRPLDDAAALADMVFSPQEQAAWQDLPSAARLAAFYKVWTRKEAVLKGLGVGLSRPAAEVEVGAEGDSRLWQDVSPPHHVWRVTDVHPWPGYVACVAVETIGSTMTLQCLDLSPSFWAAFLQTEDVSHVAAQVGARASFRGGAE